MKQFTTQATRTEPISFELNGEVFQCRPEVPGTLLLEYAAMAGQNDGAVAAKVILDFFQAVMEDEEHARFRKFTDSVDTVVDVATLGDILGWLVEQYSARPTKPPSL